MCTHNVGNAFSFDFLCLAGRVLRIIRKTLPMFTSVGNFMYGGFQCHFLTHIFLNDNLMLGVITVAVCAASNIFK